MMKRCVMLALALVVVGFSMQAQAVPGFAFSVGEGMQVTDGDVELSPFNAEAMLFYSLGLVKFDLGVLFNLENFDVAQTDFVLVRPGVRVSVPGLFYLRGAIPLGFEDDFDYGFLVGIGKHLIDLAAVSVFAELDATFMERVDFTESFPIEARIGLQIGF